jgi:hypothetical protein
MTKNFDTLLEQMLSEMMPASMYDDMGTATSNISKKIEELPGKSQHWGPLQKLTPEVREQIVKAIIQNVFPDNDENTYSIAIDNSQQLKSAIIDAVKEVAAVNPEFKANSKWAAKFLADRLSNKDLLGNVKYTTMSGEETIKKNVTQKEVKQALNKALEEAPKEAPEETQAEEPSEQEEKQAKTEMVFTKTPDVDYEPPAELQKAFDSIPEDKELSWQQVVKLIQTTPALALLDAKGLIETEKDVDEEEQEYGSELSAPDFEEDETETRGYEGEFERAMRDVGGISTSRDFNPSWD